MNDQCLSGDGNNTFFCTNYFSGGGVVLFVCNIIDGFVFALMSFLRNG